MAAKQRPCCARMTGHLTRDQNELRSLAKKAAAKDAKGQDITKLKDLIQKARVQIETDKAFIADHEAAHAGELAPA